MSIEGEDTFVGRLDEADHTPVIPTATRVITLNGAYRDFLLSKVADYDTRLAANPNDVDALYKRTFVMLLCAQDSVMEQQVWRHLLQHHTAAIMQSNPHELDDVARNAYEVIRAYNTGNEGLVVRNAHDAMMRVLTTDEREQADGASLDAASK